MKDYRIHLPPKHGACDIRLRRGGPSKATPPVEDDSPDAQSAYRLYSQLYDLRAALMATNQAGALIERALLDTSQQELRRYERERDRS